MLDLKRLLSRKIIRNKRDSFIRFCKYSRGNLDLFYKPMETTGL